MQNKKRIGVLFGGQSGEHEISRISAYNVMAVIDQDKYDITMILFQTKVADTLNFVIINIFSKNR